MGMMGGEGGSVSSDSNLLWVGKQTPARIARVATEKRRQIGNFTNLEANWGISICHKSERFYSATLPSKYIYLPSSVGNITCDTNAFPLNQGSKRGKSLGIFVGARSAYGGLTAACHYLLRGCRFGVPSLVEFGEVLVLLFTHGDRRYTQCRKSITCGWLFVLRQHLLRATCIL